MSLKPWQVIDEHLSFDGTFLRVRTQKVQLPNGHLIEDFHLLESRSWAATVAVTEENELVLVEQYRHGHGDLSLELPAGVIDAGETPKQAAARELAEETGFSSDDIQSLWQIRPEPARHSQWAHIFIAQKARRASAPQLDSTEDVRVCLLPLNELDAIVDRMVHAVHVGALLLAVRRGLIVP